MGTVKAFLGEGVGSGCMDHGAHVIQFVHVRRPRDGKEGMKKWAWKKPSPLASSCISNNTDLFRNTAFSSSRTSDGIEVCPCCVAPVELGALTRDDMILLGSLTLSGGPTRPTHEKQPFVRTEEIQRQRRSLATRYRR